MQPSLQQTYRCLFKKSFCISHCVQSSGGLVSTMVSAVCQHMVGTQFVISVVEYKVGKGTLKLKSELDSQQPVTRRDSCLRPLEFQFEGKNLNRKQCFDLDMQFS